MKAFEVHFQYRDRNDESIQGTILVDASSLPGGVARATRQFVKGLDRKQRFDMNKNGLQITAKPSGAGSEAKEKASAEAAG